MMALPVNQAAAWLAERMLNGVPVGIAVALAAWIVLRLLGRRNSSTRFAVWFSALLAIAVSPLLGSLLPRPAGAAGARASAITAPGSWATVLLIVWAVIAGVALLRVGLGLWNLRKIRANHAALAPAALHPMLQRTLSEFRLSRDVTLAISGELRVPTAIGFRKPMIILPAWTLRELPPEKLNAILIHELAHLKRWDDCTNLVQKILRALFFFNPKTLSPACPKDRMRWCLSGRTAEALSACYIRRERRESAVSRVRAPPKPSLPGWGFSMEAKTRSRSPAGCKEE